MQVQITIDTDKDAGQADKLAALAQVLGASPAAPAMPPPVKIQPKKAVKRMDTPEDDPTIADTGWAPSGTVTPLTSAKPEPIEATPTLAQLQAKAKDVIKAGKREDYKATLARFDASKLAEVDKESYASFNIALDAILGA